MYKYVRPNFWLSATISHFLTLCTSFSHRVDPGDTSPDRMNFHAKAVSTLKLIFASEPAPEGCVSKQKVEEAKAA
jgi:hypothetical protein